MYYKDSKTMYLKEVKNVIRDLMINPFKLNVERARACMSTADLAKAANVSIDTIARIYRNNGAAVRVTCTTAGKLAKALNTDVMNLIVENEN